MLPDLSQRLGCCPTGTLVGFRGHFASIGSSAIRWSISFAELYGETGPDGPAMTAFKNLSLTDRGSDWVSQFDGEDQKDAAALIDAIRPIPHEEFVKGLRTLIQTRADAAGPSSQVGLFVERELRQSKGIPQRLFKESRRVVKRAYGASLWPVQPLRAYDPRIGSEGIVAQIASELTKADPSRFKIHPSAKAFRDRHISRFFILTDLIGSGDRIWKYLESAWRVRSICSWHSYHRLEFEVLTYAATPIGTQQVKLHRSEPTVHSVLSCPTIDSAFGEEQADRIKRLCVKYDPIDNDPTDSLGRGGTGALVAFVHGIPNNAPRLLYRKGKRIGPWRWRPLFPSQITIDVNGQFGDQDGLTQTISRLQRLRQFRLAISPWLKRLDAEQRSLLLFLVSLSRGKRFDEALSIRTGLTIPEVIQCAETAFRLGFIDSQRRLTQEGQRQVTHARKWQQRTEAELPEVAEPYYPQSLRAPSKII